MCLEPGARFGEQKLCSVIDYPLLLFGVSQASLQPGQATELVCLILCNGRFIWTKVESVNWIDFIVTNNWRRCHFIQE